jgi:hypothetical protein
MGMAVLAFSSVAAALLILRAARSQREGSQEPL